MTSGEKVINLLFLLLVSHAQTKMIKIAVIDTGLDFKDTKINICDYGHADFTGQGLQDVDGHGSNISSLIDTYAENTSHCQFIIKYYDKRGYNFVAALEYAIKLKPDVINISTVGTEPSAQEAQLIKLALDEGIIIVAAAGNDARNLDLKCNYYPACSDKRVVSVGNLINPFRRNPNSNYGGRVTAWEIGTDITAGGYTLSGTSQASAIRAGKLIKELGQHGFIK